MYRGFNVGAARERGLMLNRVKYREQEYLNMIILEKIKADYMLFSVGVGLEVGTAINLYTGNKVVVGSWAGSPQKPRISKSANASFGWILGYPPMGTKREVWINDFLSGISVNISLGFPPRVGGGISVVKDEKTDKWLAAIEIGIYTPGVSISGSLSWTTKDVTDFLEQSFTPTIDDLEDISADLWNNFLDRYGYNNPPAHSLGQDWFISLDAALSGR